MTGLLTRVNQGKYEDEREEKRSDEGCVRAMDREEG